MKTTKECPLLGKMPKRRILPQLPDEFDKEYGLVNNNRYEENNNDIDIPVKTKAVYVEEMDLEEAIVQMEMLSHTFFVYKDSENGDIAIVYKRNDGRYGLLEVKD